MTRRCGCGCRLHADNVSRGICDRCYAPVPILERQAASMRACLVDLQARHAEQGVSGLRDGVRMDLNSGAAYSSLGFMTNATMTTIGPMLPKFIWRVVCHGCGANYLDTRRRVGSCAVCGSQAVIVCRAECNR